VIGIVLAGGTGSRLYPLTFSVSKQLLPVFDKPMVFYPIATLMMAGIREIVIVTTPQDQSAFARLLGDGEELGLKFNYVVQPSPNGIAAVFGLCEPYISNRDVCLILGDNIFHGNGLGRELEKYTKNLHGARIFGYSVANPSDYGVVELDVNGKIISLEEKPVMPKSNLAIPGLYFYDNRVLDISKSLKPSKRGELEITSVNEEYMKLNCIDVSVFPRGTAWFDTGTFENLADASTYVRILETRQGIAIASLPEIAWRNGWITSEELSDLALSEKQKNQKDYLINLLGP
jgi:glucose-1-phosphate thymidylyltransferase